MARLFAVAGLSAPAFADAEPSPLLRAQLAACTPEAKAMPNPLKGDAEASRRGQAMFQNICFSCHGVFGQGDGPASALIGGASDLTSPSRRAQMTDGQRFRVVQVGVPGTAMQPFGVALSDEEIWSLVAYLDDLAGKVGRSSAAAGGPLPELLPQDPVVMGALSVQQVALVLKRSEAGLEPCRLGDGWALFAFEVRGSGRVARVSVVESRVTEHASLGCVQARLEALPFPVAPDGEATWAVVPVAVGR